MSFGPVINLAAGYVQSLFTGAGQGSSSTTTPSVGNTQGTNQLSPFAQILSGLQQLEQSSLSAYQQVTQQVAGKLQTASQSATVAGNAALSSQLTQLSTDFQNASTSGQLPNVQDLAQALGGGGYYHHHHGGGYSSSSASVSSGSNANSSLSALSIIDNTLSSAGIQIG
jgi:hypothetical protein